MQQTIIKRVKDWTQLSREREPPGVVQKMKFDDTTKWYMHKLEGDGDTILRDFEIHTDHLIPARRPNLIIVLKKKNNLSKSELCRPGGPQSENQRKRKQRQVLIPCKKTTKGTLK